MNGFPESQMSEDVPTVNPIILTEQKRFHAYKATSLKNNTKYEIKEIVFKRNRFYVVLYNTEGKTKTVTRAIYNWLHSNPSFIEIPKGYVIHHLDHDETNDDTSNLALMFKLHHVAHHFKQITTETPIRVEGYELYIKTCADLFQPTTKPKIYWHKPAKRFYVQFAEKDGVGRSVRRRLWKSNGQSLLLKEDAEKFANQIWKNSLGNK